jgi:phosphoribosylanthranilate isomerase
MIFFEESPRRVEVETAAEIATAYRRRCEVVGVFVNAPLDDVLTTLGSVPLTMLQFHGDEGPSYCAEAARRSGLKVMKAVRAKDANAVKALSAYKTDLHMLDAYVPGTYGGTGERFDWELAAAHPGRPPLVLSGGLTPDNVAHAMSVANPYAVDVASGVEAEPGVKDTDKLRRFFAAVEQAAAPA